MVDATTDSRKAVPNLLWVEPRRINLVYAGGDPCQFIRTAVPVMDGDWDMPREKRFHELDACQALEARLPHNLPWEGTRFYSRVVNEIGSGKAKWGCNSIKEFRRRLERLERLHSDIRDGGYKTQRQLGRDLLRHQIQVAMSGQDVEHPDLIGVGG